MPCFSQTRRCMSYISSDETEASCYLLVISQAICSTGWAAVSGSIRPVGISVWMRDLAYEAKECEISTLAR